MRFGGLTRRILTALFIILNLFFLPLIMYIPSLAFVEGKDSSHTQTQVNVCYLQNLKFHTFFQLQSTIFKLSI